MVKDLRVLFPGVLLCVTLGMAAAFVAAHYGGPTLLYALLLGMAFHFLSQEGRCVAGINFSARKILRLGVALLGVRITLEQITALGWLPLLLVVTAVPATIVMAYALGRLLGLSRSQSVLTGGAVAICGASAAMAISAVLPHHKQAEHNLIFTVIGVTALSTVAMVVYPLIVSAAGLDPTQAGVFLGGTIHDVAQVVGAGYMVSDTTGNVATFTKLLRVAMLVPVVLVISLLVAGRRAGTSGVASPMPLPGFLLAFLLIIAINSMGWLPAAAVETSNGVSRWCLVIAIAAIGAKASFRELAQLGWRPMLLLVSETLFMAAVVFAGLLAMQ